MAFTQNNALSSDTVNDALKNCASEPVHTPGTVQPFACLVCLDKESAEISHVSENCQEILGVAPNDLLGQNFRDFFGPDVWHGLMNAVARNGLVARLTHAGTCTYNDKTCELSASSTSTTYIVQFEPQRDGGLVGTEALAALSFLMRKIQSCENDEDLFSLSTQLLRHMTGYDRVMIYRFDPNFNGQVLKESRQSSLPSFDGLWFPHWDIPSQAREMMTKIPLRIIEDTDQEPVPLIARSRDFPPLDITFAECRGVSLVHMEYLKNMGVRGTMTLSVVVEGTLWGIISFHHKRPRLPGRDMRDVLIAFLGMFCTKVGVLQKQAKLALAQKIDLLKDRAVASIETADPDTELQVIGPAILEAMESDGLAVMTGSDVKRFGKAPSQTVLEHLAKRAEGLDAQPLCIDSAEDLFPGDKTECQGLAGALVAPDGTGRTLFLFRRERSATMSWAGNPDKTIDVTSGSARLRPRGSFSVFLEEIKGRASPWTNDHLATADRIWMLIQSAERQVLRNTVQRQQDLMINELNHRVRNILSLVRSVSRQARRHNSSLESYSQAIEKRIQALAAAHDLASGSARYSVLLKDLIKTELEPYQSEERASFVGDGQYLRSDVAPIFSLVIHELVTNAVKYGALSAEEGRVVIKLSAAKDGVTVSWRESNGPAVKLPSSRGFGTTLIEQAVPYEMGGTTELRFAPSGVEADFFLPNDILEKGNTQTGAPAIATKKVGTDEPKVGFDPAGFEGLLLIVEDNFTIAKDMRDVFTDLGFVNVDVCSNVNDALDLIETEPVGFAVMDVNLGPGKTSEPIGLKLLEQGVPFVFVTGYGDQLELAPQFSHVPRLVKPVVTSHLIDAMAEIMTRQPE